MYNLEKIQKYTLVGLEFKGLFKIDMVHSLVSIAGYAAMVGWILFNLKRKYLQFSQVYKLLLHFHTILGK